MSNKNNQLIWERYESAAVSKQGQVLMFEALQEAVDMLEEAQVTPEMVQQINTALGGKFLKRPLTVDQVTQIQGIANPGAVAATGGALGKLGGWLKGGAERFGKAVHRQVTDPESGLRTGLRNVGDKVAGVAGDFKAGMDQGYDQGQADVAPVIPEPAPAPDPAFGPGTSKKGKARFTGKKGKVHTGKEAKKRIKKHYNLEEQQELIDSLRPGWSSKMVNYIDYSEMSRLNDR